EAVERFVRAVCAAARDDEVEDRVRSVRDTGGRLGAGGEATGWPTLARLLGRDGEAIVSRVRDWLAPAEPATAGVDAAPWPDPVPLAGTPDVPPYPIEVLPEWLREWGEAV